MAISAPQILQLYPWRKQNIITSFFYCLNMILIWQEVKSTFFLFCLYGYTYYEEQRTTLNTKSLLGLRQGLLLLLSMTGQLPMSSWAVCCLGLPSSTEALGWSYHDWLVRAIWRCELHPHVCIQQVLHPPSRLLGRQYFLGFKAWLKCILFQKVSLTASLF